MTPFALVIRWSGQPEPHQVEGLLDPISSNASEDRATGSVPGAAFAVGLRSIFAGETVNWGFAVDRARKRLIVGDVRLYARTDRRTLSDLPPDAPDVAVILSAYDRFGRGVASRLVGDFAFVVWDWGERRLFAARDHFGLKPLYFRSIREGVVLAADPRQLFHVGERITDIDSQSVMDYLLKRFSHGGRTYFTDIRQVRPAHGLSAVESGMSQERYWLPRHESVRAKCPEDYLEGWRDLLRTCVEERLASAFPVGAHLSGGLDSGCIIRLAHDTYRGGRVDLPRFLMLSATFPGLACDETDNINAVARTVPGFEAIAWDGRVANFADLEDPMLTAPAFRGGMGGGPTGDLQAAKEYGIRTILCGIGGDEIFRAGGIFGDIVRTGRVLTLVDELARLPTWARRRHLRDGLRAIAPAFLLDRTRRFRSRPDNRPEWLGPALDELYPGEPDDQHRGSFAFGSNLHRELWRLMTLPRLGSLVEFQVLSCRDAGTEARMPYLDVRLAEYIMAIPWEHRLPHGDMRRLQRDGARQMLPDSVIASPKVTFEAAFYHQFTIGLASIRNILYDHRWVCGRFVNQSAARCLLRQVEENGPRANAEGGRNLWRIASLEVWLRAVNDHFAEYEGHHHERFAERRGDGRSDRYSVGSL